MANEYKGLAIFLILVAAFFTVLFLSDNAVSDGKTSEPQLYDFQAICATNVDVGAWLINTDMIAMSPDDYQQYCKGE